MVCMKSISALIAGFAFSLSAAQIPNGTARITATRVETSTMFSVIMALFQYPIQ